MPINLRCHFLCVLDFNFNFLSFRYPKFLILSLLEVLQGNQHQYRFLLLLQLMLIFILAESKVLLGLVVLVLLANWLYLAIQFSHPQVSRIKSKGRYHSLIKLNLDNQMSLVHLVLQEPPISVESPLPKLLVQLFPLLLAKLNYLITLMKKMLN